MNTQKKKIFCKQNIPNMLVVFRMVLAIVVAVFLILNHYLSGNANPIIYQLHGPKWMPLYISTVKLYFLLAGILFIIASITDWLDGFLARRNNWVSDFGKIWDPIADKVLVNTVLICFAWMGYITIIIPIIMIARDVAVDAQKALAGKKGIVVPANFWGKCKTVLQMVGIVLIFFFFAYFAYNGTQIDNVFYWSIQQLMLYLATVMSVVSGVVYFKQINKAMKETNHASKN